MLLREVEYARPSSVDEADRAPGGARRRARARRRPDARQRDEGARGLARRARRPEPARRAARDHGVAATRSSSARWRRTRRSWRSSEVEVSRPILAEVAAQIADVQVRNRGTIGGNVCSNDPTNHLPPLLVALGASMTIRGAGGERTVPAEEFFLGVYLTAVGEGELLLSVSVPAAAKAADGFASITIGRDGTCIANAAASLAGGATRIALGCVDAVPVLLTPSGSRRGERPRRPSPTRRSSRRPTSTPRPTTAATSPASAPCAPSRRQRREGGERGRARPRAARSRSRSTATSTSARSTRAACSSTSSATTST